MIPDAHLGHRFGADPRFPLAQVQEERELSSFARRIHAELIGAFLDQQLLPACAEGLEFGPALDPQSRCRPEFRAVGHDHRVSAKLQALGAVAGRKGGGCCTGVVASPRPVQQIAVEAPERHRGALFAKELTHRTDQDDDEHTCCKGITVHLIAFVLKVPLHRVRAFVRTTRTVRRSPEQTECCRQTGPCQAPSPVIEPALPNTDNVLVEGLVPPGRMAVRYLPSRSVAGEPQSASRGFLVSRKALAAGSWARKRGESLPATSAQSYLLCSGTARAVRYYSRKTGRLAPLR